MATDRTHAVEVDGVGRFVFRKRNFRLQLELEGRAERMTGGPVQGGALQTFAMSIATLEVLTADAPEGWDLASVDPLDDDAFGQVLQVWQALLQAEATFRRGAQAGRAPVGPAA